MKNKNFKELLDIKKSAANNKLKSTYKIDKIKSENIDFSYLEPKDSSKLVGIFKPGTAGKKKLTTIFKYNESCVTLDFAETEVIQVLLVAELLAKLPDKLVANSEHIIEFLIKNTSGLSATNIEIDGGALLFESITITEEIIGGQPSTKPIYSLREFNSRSKTERKLDTNKQFRVKATFRAKEETGIATLDTLIKYKESATLVDKDEQLGLSLNKLKGGSTTIIGKLDDRGNPRVFIEGKVSIPDQLKLDQEETVEFTFENKSSEYPATGVVITIYAKEGYSIKQDTEFKKKILGQLEAGAYYKESYSIKIEKITLINNIALEAEFSYREGISVVNKIQLLSGIFPKQGPAFFTISDNGLVSIIEAQNKNKKPGYLKMGIQLALGQGGSIVWNETLKQAVAVGGNGYIARSNNGLLWEYAVNPGSKGLTKVKWNSHLKHYISIGMQGALLISENGKDWDEVNVETQMDLRDVIWCSLKHHYIIIGDSGYIALSQDGMSWQPQKCPVESNLISIASNESDKNIRYMLITNNNEVIESLDGKNWHVSLTTESAKGAHVKEMKTIFFNPTDGVASEEFHITGKFFSIVSSSGSKQGENNGIYRWFCYDKDDYTLTSVWHVDGELYLSDFYVLEDVRKIVWLAELGLYVGIAKQPSVFFNKRKFKTYIFDRLEETEDFHKFNKDGFSDITLGSISEFSNDEKTAYYDLTQYASLSLIDNAQ